MLMPSPFRTCLRLGALLGATAEAGLRMALTERREAALGRWAGRALRCLGVELEQEGPLAPAPLLVSNHLSWVDPLVLLSLRPGQPLAKAEVATYPLLGPLVRAAGVRFVRREDPMDRARALRRLWQDLRGIHPVLLFPEGTTTDGSGLAPLARGGLAAAYRQGLPIQPVRLDCRDAGYPWLGDAALGPHLKALLAARATTVTVRPRPLLHPADHRDLDHWLEAVRLALHP